MSKNYETPDIIGVMALDNYLLYLKFDTNKFYNKLKDTKYFKEVEPRGDSVQWQNGEDVSPENLYYDSIDINEFQGIIKQLD